MMIVMKPTATEEEIQAVIERIEAVGARAHPSRGEEVTVIGAIGDREREVQVAELGLETAPGVDRVVPILKPYKLASKQFNHDEPSVLRIAGTRVGGEHFTLIAGPCTVESRDQTMTAAHAVKEAGATMFRGGAYKPRTSPYAFQGLGEEGLAILAEARALTGLPVVTEALEPEQVPLVAAYADMLQIGSRNMSNFPLLRRAAASGKPILLKGCFSATVE